MDSRPSRAAHLDELTDAALLQAADADAAAFRVLYDRHAERVFAYFRNRGVDHHGALDLTGETFAEAWQCRQRYRDPGDGAVGPWLFGIARNLLSHLRRRHVIATTARQRLGLVEPAAHDCATEAAFEAVLGLDPCLDRTLEELSPQNRRLVELRVVEQQSYDEIARHLDCTPLAARIRLSRALNELRTHLTAGPMEESQ
jgi:RNA polymerase sigma-70 factor, ECF subfamily